MEVPSLSLWLVILNVILTPLKHTDGAGEMTQQEKHLTALSEDQGLNPITHMVPNNM